MRLEGYDFVIAKAGFNKKYNRDVSWQELKDTFTLYKRIPMIAAAGDHYGRIDPNNAVGFVDAKIDEESQTIRGEPIFYEEKFEHVPSEIQQRLLYKQFIPASLGYEQFGNLRKVDHILIGAKDPVFPDVGINAEDGFYYEETEGMSSNKEEQKKMPEAPEYVTKEDFAKFSSQVLEMLKARETPPPEPQMAVVEEEEEEVIAENEAEEAEEEMENSPPPSPKVEPERVIAKGTASKSGWLTDEEGRRYLSFKVAGTTEEQQQKKT